MYVEANKGEHPGMKQNRILKNVREGEVKGRGSDGVLEDAFGRLNAIIDIIIWILGLTAKN